MMGIGVAKRSLKFVWNLDGVSNIFCNLGGSYLDPSAAADRRIRRRIFVRRKSAGKITACRISRRILLAVNPP